ILFDRDASLRLLRDIGGGRRLGLRSLLPGGALGGGALGLLGGRLFIDRGAKHGENQGAGEESDESSGESGAQEVSPYGKNQDSGKPLSRQGFGDCRRPEESPQASPLAAGLPV